MKHGVPFVVSPTECLLLELDGRRQRLRGVPLRVHLAQDVAKDLVGQPLGVGAVIGPRGADDVCQWIQPEKAPKIAFGIEKVTAALLENIRT